MLPSSTLYAEWGGGWGGISALTAVGHVLLGADPAAEGPGARGTIRRRLAVRLAQQGVEAVVQAGAEAQVGGAVLA